MEGLENQTTDLVLNTSQYLYNISPIGGNSPPNQIQLKLAPE